MNTNKRVLGHIHHAADRRRFLQGLGWATGTAAAFSIPGMWPGLVQAATYPVVETAYGKVRGYTSNGIHIFKGIRYGASTHGVNRFKPPVKPAPWTGIVDASNYGFRAPQTNPALRDSGQSASNVAQMLAASDGFRAAPAEREDCLFLNVWTRAINENRRRPVMVWLHGGGFSSGAASDLMYDGTSLVERGDVVFVGVNHRLNVFGYTHLAEIGGASYAGSGNAGMLDIVAALEWVRDHIDRFGGDPGRVMIFGESGGGSKVSMLLGCPPAQGLFHRAVIESGPGLLMTEGLDATRAASLLLEELSIGKDALNKLHTLPTDAILTAYFTIQPKLSGGGMRNFAPVLEPGILPAHPFHPQATELSKNVPLLIGWNRTESTLFSLGDEKLFNLNEAGLRERLKPQLGDNTDRAIEICRAANPDLQTPSDVYFVISSYTLMGLNSIRLAERKAAQQSAPVYLYRFDWKTPVQGGRLRSPHAVEMPFVFDNVRFGGEALTGGGDEAVALAAKVSAAWIAFASEGNPNTDALPEWKTYDAVERNTMLLNTDSRLISDPTKGMRELLEGIVPV